MAVAWDEGKFLYFASKSRGISVPQVGTHWNGPIQRWAARLLEEGKIAHDRVDQSEYGSGMADYYVLTPTGMHRHEELSREFRRSKGWSTSAPAPAPVVDPVVAEKLREAKIRKVLALYYDNPPEPHRDELVHLCKLIVDADFVTVSQV